MRSYSQYGEDTWIADNLKPTLGTFCEVGAFNGIGCSNTLMFEELGWAGACIEPVPESAASCFRNRRCHTICCAVGASTKIDLFHYNYIDMGACGLADHCVREFTRLIPVPVLRLDDVFKLLCPEGPKLLSVDTEGTEINALESLGTYRPEIIIAEYKTFDGPPNDQALIAFLWNMGYKEVHRTMCNQIFHRTA